MEVIVEKKSCKYPQNVVCETMADKSNYFCEMQQDFWFAVIRKGDFRNLWKPQIEIIFMLKGKGKIQFGNMKTLYQVQEEDIFVINSFEVHSFELEEDAAALSLTMSLRFVNACNPEILKYQINCRSFLHERDNQDIFDILRQNLAATFEEEYKNVSHPSLYLKSKAVAVVEDLGKYFLDRHKDSESKGNFDSLIPAVNYIQSHYRESISLEDLAKETFLSKTYISRSFTKYFGISFTDYVTLLRVIYASKMLRGKMTISEIALESGFPNINSMIAAFKCYKGVTPKVYRKNQELEAQKRPEEKSKDGVREEFISLMKYLTKKTQIEHLEENMTEISVKLTGRKQKVSAHWKRIINAGYARSITDGTIQKEIRYIQKKIGFEYIRIKGIVDDDMCLLRKDMNGKTILNYAYVDEVLDFIVSADAKPMLEISYMPEILVGRAVFHSMRNTSFGVPKDIGQWHDFVKELLLHIVSRYGEGKVRSWIFIPWIPPDFADFGMFDLEEYEEIYYASYSAIKEVNSEFLIAGPGSTDIECYLKWFFTMCKRKNCIPDVLTFRSFGAGGGAEENELKLIGNNESFPMAVSGDENLIFHRVLQIKKALRAEGLQDIPIVLEEWSNNVWQRDLCNDTCYKSAYLFKNILENNHHLNGMGYFTINDRIDEVPPTTDTFHGGFGLFTQNDIPKSACRAMELLGKMGERLLQKGDGYYITCTEESIQIFLYNYSHYDLLYRYRHVVEIDKTNRYNVFVTNLQRAFYIKFEDMEPGRYKIRRYGITKEGGSSYDLWVKMGAPDNLEYSEVEFIKNLSQTLYQRETEEVKEDGTLRIKASLKSQDIWLIEIEKR